MSLDIVTLRDNIITMLNLGLASLNTGLTRSISSVVAGRPENGISTLKLPSLLMSLDDYEETFNTLGPALHRDCRFTLNFYPITVYGIGSTLGNGQSNAEDEATRLTQNLLNLIRSYPSLNENVSWVDGINVEFNQEFGEESSYVKCHRISVRCFKFIS